MRWVSGAVIIFLLTGCAAEEGPMQKSGSGEVRHDLAPLTERFPQLGTPESASWSSGTLGDERNPGPSLYWIDAVIELPRADFDTLASSYELTAATPQNVDVAVPNGELLRSDELDADFSRDEYRSSVYLDEASSSMVLSTVFE